MSFFMIMKVKAMIQTRALVTCTDPPISETTYFIECDYKKRTDGR